MVDRVSSLAARHLVSRGQSKVRTRNGPRVMAALRNLAIGALRMAGRIDVTEATDGPDAPWTAHSPSSDSHHDLGTALGLDVGYRAAAAHRRLRRRAAEAGLTKAIRPRSQPYRAQGEERRPGDLPDVPSTTPVTENLPASTSSSALAAVTKPRPSTW